MTHRRILFIARSLPEPADDGYRIRVRALASGLAKRHEVTLIGHADAAPDASVAALRADGIDARWTPMLHHQTSVRRLRRLATGRPWFTRSAEDPGLRSVVAQVLAERRFDLIQLESSEFAGIELPPRTPVVIDEHNIWSELTERRRRIRMPGPGSLGDRVEIRQVARIEERAWANAAGVVFCSDREAHDARLRTRGGQFGVVPNGVDLRRFQPMDASAEERALMTFVGLLRYTPNADAVRWFVRAILPLIRRSVSDARFAVVGKSPSPGLRALAGDGVDIVGTVADVRPSLARAAVVVVPLRVGSGTRIKILQALAMGKAVVSTSVGCEGLDVRDGEHLLVADDPGAFAAAVVRLIGDPTLRARLGDQGRELVRATYGWERSVDRLDAFHDEILGRQALTDASAS